MSKKRIFIRKLNKRPIAFGLGAVLVCLSAPGMSTMAAEVADQRDVSDALTVTEVLQGQYCGFVDVPWEVESIYSDGQEYPVLRGNTLPTYYDAREQGVITSVKNQIPWGCCWSYSAISVLESSLISNRQTKDIDLSESFLAYGSYKKLPDPMGGTDNDGLEMQTSFREYLERGGNIAVAYHALTSRYGAVKETDAPMPTNSEEAEDFESKMDEQLPEQEVFLQQLHEINISDQDAIKEEIMRYGGASCPIYYSIQKLNMTTGGYFCNDVRFSRNHAITLVGWDDSFDKNLFNDTPTKDGAWLVKNSWGENFGHDGYMWVSYEDTSLGNADVLVGELDREYDHNYQYDGCYYSASVSSLEKIANVFTVPDTGREEILTAVSVVFNSPNAEYSIQLYKLEEEAVRQDEDGCLLPEEGTPLLKNPLNGKMTFAGYYVIDLPEEVVLQPKDQFAVVVTNEDLSAKFSIERTKEWNETFYTAGVEEDQSLYFKNGKWVDCVTQAETTNTGNFRIKTFGNLGDPVKPKPTVSPSPTVEPTVSPDPTTKPTVSPTPITVPEYVDVKKEAWYYDALVYVVQNGIMTGVSKTEFDPTGILTRSQMVQVLYNHEGKPDGEYENWFVDVEDGAWYAQAVLWAATYGITAGIGDSLFGTEDPITREQFLRMLYLYAIGDGKITQEDLSEDRQLEMYSDQGDISDWAREAFTFFVKKNVISGKPDKEDNLILDPQGELTRAEAAQIISNYDRLLPSAK